jgi:hypothetical protein
MLTHTPTLLDILAHTPLWVWALFAFVLFMGYQRTRDRIVPLWRLLVLPALLLVLTISGWLTAGLGSLPAIAVGFIAGGTLGWLLVREGSARRLEGNRLWLRGDWWSFLQIVAILAFRYATTVAGIVNPAFAADPVWHPLTLLLSSALKGLFLGRLAARLRVFLTSVPAAA